MPAVVVAALAAFFRALVPVLMTWGLKMLMGLGVSFVSYKLLGLAVQKVLDRFSDTYSSIPPEIIGFLGLAGIPEAFNIVLGGFSFSFGIWATYRSLKFLSK